MTTATAPTREAIQRKTVSEYPFRVFSYQFKHLNDARAFAKQLVAIPRTCHEAKVEMYHRRVEVRRTSTDDKGAPTSVIQPVVLDVTTRSPEEAEAAWCL